MGRRPRHLLGQRPGKDVIGIVLTTDTFVTAFPPPAIIQDFWTCLYAALGD